MNASEVGGDLAMIQTSLLSTFNVKKHWNNELHNKTSKVFINTRSPAASLPFSGQVTEQTAVKGAILLLSMMYFPSN